jgi:pyridoxal 5'-phosphate synthase glutaminase subunit Pdx2
VKSRPYCVSNDQHNSNFPVLFRRQVRTPQDLDELDGIVLPGGESTAMGLIGTSTVAPTSSKTKNMWESLQDFSKIKPIWGTCAGMILLAERCVGTSAVIEDGQALIGGVDITVARNYFGSQISSFEMPVPPPPGYEKIGQYSSFPGVFIRAPAILEAGPTVEVLGKVIAIPCRQAAATLAELERKIASGENVIKMGVVHALERESSLRYEFAMSSDQQNCSEENDELRTCASYRNAIELPGAADGTNAREVICAAKKGHLLCTAFHPELTDDYRWHEYFMDMVKESKTNQP